MLALRYTPAPLNECELSPAAQARIAPHDALRLCEPLASLAPARRKHAPAALRGHSRFESVIAFATAIVRLKCALHETPLLPARHQKDIKKCAPRKSNC
jgi:hypothetical protein